MEEGPGLLLQDRERKTMHGQDRLRLELLAQDEIFSFSFGARSAGRWWFTRAMVPDPKVVATS